MSDKLKPLYIDLILSDLRKMKQKNNGYEEIGYGDMYIDGYNKAIDDVLEKLEQRLTAWNLREEEGGE